MSVWDNIYHGNLETIINSMAKDEDKYDLCMALQICKRIDLLEQCLMLPGFRKFAEDEYDIYLRHKEWEIKDKLKRDNYPDILKKWDAVLKNSNKVGIWAVEYPSNLCKRIKVEGDYVAISGDGMHLFSFRIISMEKEQFLFVKEDRESRYSTNFKEIANCKDFDILSGTQILDALIKIHQ